MASRVRSGPDGRGTGGATEVPADRLPPATRRSVPAVYAVEEPEEELDGEKARGEQLLLKELALARGRMGVRESRERERESGGFFFALVRDDARLIQKNPAIVTTDTWTLNIGEQ
jgi:hypothetical protein